MKTNVCEQARVRLTILFAWLTVMGLPVVSSATGTKDGGGGNAVVCYTDTSKAKKVSVDLFDYWEQPKDRKVPYTLDLGGPEVSVQEKLNRAFKRLARFDRGRMETYRDYANTLLKNIDDYLEEGINLGPLADDNGHILPAPPCYKERFAVQKINPMFGQKRFLIDADFYRSPQTSNDTRAGIILHEVIYQDALAKGHENSDDVRFFNFVISSNWLDSQSSDTFKFFVDMADRFDRAKPGQGLERTCEVKPGFAECIPFQPHVVKKHSDSYTFTENCQITMAERIFEANGWQVVIPAGAVKCDKSWEMTGLPAHVSYASADGKTRFHGDARRFYFLEHSLERIWFDPGTSSNIYYVSPDGKTEVEGTLSKIMGLISEKDKAFLVQFVSPDGEMQVRHLGKVYEPARKCGLERGEEDGCFGVAFDFYAGEGWGTLRHVVLKTPVSYAKDGVLSVDQADILLFNPGGDIVGVQVSTNLKSGAIEFQGRRHPLNYVVFSSKENKFFLSLKDSSEKPLKISGGKVTLTFKYKDLQLDPSGYVIQGYTSKFVRAVHKRKETLVAPDTHKFEDSKVFGYPLTEQVSNYVRGSARRIYYNDLYELCRSMGFARAEDSTKVETQFERAKTVLLKLADGSIREYKTASVVESVRCVEKNQTWMDALGD